jgi:hypothetical protein
MSAIKYGKVYPIKDERGLITDFKVRPLLLLLLLLLLLSYVILRSDLYCCGHNIVKYSFVALLCADLQE